MPEYTKPEVGKIARKQKAVIWLTLIFTISLVYFSVATIQWVAEWARDVSSNKHIQEWVRIQILKEAVGKPNSKDAFAKFRPNEAFPKPSSGRLFLLILSAWLPHLPYKPVAAVAIINLVFVYQLARALKLSWPWLWTVSMCVPFTSLVVLLCLDRKATNVLRSKGIAVGLMGAKRAELKNLALSD